MLRSCIYLSFVALALTQAWAQGVQPYPNAVTDRLVREKTAMPAPKVNTVFRDHDFGSKMVRITDENTDPKHPLGYFRNTENEKNMFAADDSKLFVVGEGGATLAFGFDPDTMKISSLPGAGPGPGFRVPLRTGATFSYVDPDTIYGANPRNPLTVSAYHFSTATTTPVFDATACGTNPALIAGPKVVIGDLTLSNDDHRLAVTAGGNQFGNREFVIIYDTNLECRWYNTKTGMIGGQWGPVGKSTSPISYLIRHASISGSGRYVKISIDKVGFFVWDVTTLNVKTCYITTGPNCDGYGSLGKDLYVSGRNSVDEMDTLLRPLKKLNNITHLVDLPLPHYLGMERHFTWNDGHLDDTAPVCGSTYAADGRTDVTQPYDGEIFCVETDGVNSTVWRFAHNRASWDPEYFWTESFGNVSLDGKFLLFTSGWDGLVGVNSDGDPRTDVWMVKLE